MTSASCSSRWARSVRRSSAPGPAPISQTTPGVVRGMRLEQRLGVVAGAGDEVLVEPPRLRLGQQLRHAIAQRRRRAARRCPSSGASMRLDPRPHQPRQHRRLALGRDRDRQRRAIDDRGRVEIALLGHVDDVERNAARARRELGRVAVGAVVGDEAKRGVVEVGRLEGARDNRQPASCEKSASMSREIMTTDAVVLMANRALLRASSPPPTMTMRLTLDFVAQRECVEFTHSGPFVWRVDTRLEPFTTSY